MLHADTPWQIKFEIFQKRCWYRGSLFFWSRLPEKRGSNFSFGGRKWVGVGCCGLHRNYGVVVILLSVLCNYNLILRLHQKKLSYLDAGWLFIDRFKAGNVPGMSVVLGASKNENIEIHEYDASPLIKSYISCK